MTMAEWGDQWARLAQFRVSGDAKREDISGEWFAQLRHFHVDAVDHGVSQLIGSARDTFLPGLGALKECIQSRIDKYDRSNRGCQTCHGSTLIDAQPWMSNGIIYDGLTRCPDCGVPAPPAPYRPGMRALSLHEVQTHQSAPQYDYMPDGMKAKPGREAPSDARSVFTKLRSKLGMP